MLVHVHGLVCAYAADCVPRQVAPCTSNRQPKIIVSPETFYEVVDDLDVDVDDVCGRPTSHVQFWPTFESTILYTFCFTSLLCTRI